MYIVPKNGEEAIQVQSNHSDYGALERLCGARPVCMALSAWLVLPKNLEYRRLGVSLPELEWRVEGMCPRLVLSLFLFLYISFQTAMKLCVSFLLLLYFFII